MPHQETQDPQNGFSNDSLAGDVPSLSSNGRASKYGDHHSYDASRRPLHIVIAGAGPSGIAMAIQLMTLPHITFEIFEKNPEVGGTWFENKYLGAACDVASHAYQYTFASNHEWSSQ